MEYFLVAFLGVWISVFGIFFKMALNKEFAKYDVQLEATQTAGSTAGGEDR